MPTSDKLSQYVDELMYDYRAGREQREKANEELRFCLVPGGQWEDFMEGSYEKRARMEVDQTSEYLWRTHDDWVNNRYAPTFSPDDDVSSDDDAKLLNGLFRRDMYRKGGVASLDTSILEAMACGYGAIVLNTQYEDDEDPDNLRQNIVVSEQANAYRTVFFDSGATRADKSDAKRCTILTPWTMKAFKDQYPDVDTKGLAVLNQSNFNWSNNDLIYVATRYHIEKKGTLVHTYANPLGGELIRLDDADVEADEQELQIAGYERIYSKKIYRRNVYKTVFVDGEVLEPTRRIVGKHIPVIPFYGYRAYIDGVEQYHGLARKRMDAQRTLNMTISLMAEGAAGSHSAKPIFSKEQMPPHIANTWAENTHQKPYMLAEPIRDRDGNIKHLGPTGYLEGSKMSSDTAALVQTMHEFIRMGTGGAPQDIADPDASGKAINALIKRSDKNVGIIFDNIKKSIKHMGDVYLSMASEVYAGRENIGRVVRMMNDKDETETVTLLDRGAKDGQIVTVNDVSKGRFEVVVDVGRSYETEREESVEALKDLVISLNPQDPDESALRKQIIGKIIQLLPATGLDDIRWEVRKKELMAGAAPESDEEKQFVEQYMHSVGQQGDDPNTAYLKAAAAEQETQAMLNQTKIEDMKASTVKKLAEAKETEIDALVKGAQLRSQFMN